jgi:Arc/MetJ-type ribon-helix-helix transcriptional regulator
MRTISVRLDDGCEARLDNLCKNLGLSQSEVVKAGLVLLQQQSTSPAALAEHLGLVGSFSSDTPDSGTTAGEGTMPLCSVRS